MKRTLLVTLDFHPSIGGVSRYWEYLGDELPPDSFFVLAPLLPKHILERPTRYVIHRRRLIPRWLYPHWVPLLIAVYRTCRRYRIERMVAAQILPVGIAVSLVGRILRIPYLVSAHGMDLEFARKKRRKLAVSKKILRRSERVIVNTTTTGRAVTSFGIPQSKIEYIYPAPAITPVLLTSDRTVIPAVYQGKKILLTVSRLVQRKGHELVLQALPGILAEMPDVLYCIIGDGPYRFTLETRTRELGIERAVVFTGVLTDAE
ncbi:MAG: glycosyltransferase, partial [Patescibacteria group bacterium]